RKLVAVNHAPGRSLRNVAHDSSDKDRASPIYILHTSSRCEQWASVGALQQVLPS
ncbi:unnamed protein product, partial [Musa textilis]